MGWWTADSRSPGATTCGTMSCAGGHGPIAGIPSLPGEYWGDYIPRVFGNDTRLTNYMFGSSWAEYDNTPQGAGKRILYALNNEIPTGERRYDPTVHGGRATPRLREPRPPPNPPPRNPKHP